MVRHTLFLDNGSLLEKFSKYSKIYGVLFLLLGIAGIVYPVAMSLATALFYGWILIFSGFLIGMHTWQTNKKDWLGWLKSVIGLIVGVLIILNPVTGIAVLGLLFAAYFLMDAFASVSLAFELRPTKGWWVSLLNGIITAAIGIYFILGWPFSSIVLVGLLVGISLFFDGILLLVLGNSAKELTESAKKS